MPVVNITTDPSAINITASLMDGSAEALLARTAAQAAQVGAETAQGLAETAKADAETAQASAEAARDVILGTDISGKADQVDLDATNLAVAGKVDQSSLDVTNAAVATKADDTATTAALALKANQSSLDTTNAAVALKADQAALDAANVLIAANALAIAGIDVSSYVAQEDLDTLEAVVIEGLGNLATDIAANTNAIANVSIHYDFLLNHDLDLAGNTAGPGESDPEIVIDLATGFGNHDLDS